MLQSEIVRYFQRITLRNLILLQNTEGKPLQIERMDNHPLKTFNGVTTNLLIQAAYCIHAWPWEKFGQSFSQICSLTCATDQFRCIKILLNTIDLSTRPYGINTINSAVISQSLVLRSDVFGWTYRNWPIAVSFFTTTSVARNGM